MHARRIIGPVLAVALLSFALSTANAQVVINGRDAGPVVTIPGGMWGMGMNPGANFDYFVMTISTLNMTPDFTLDKEAKQKIQAVRDEWTAANAKFREDNKDELKRLQEDQMEAFKDRDQKAIQALAEKTRELYARGPKGEEYIAKVKAALTADQLKIVEEKVKKAEEDRKAMMEKWQRRNPGALGGAGGGAPQNPTPAPNPAPDKK